MHRNRKRPHAPRTVCFKALSDDYDYLYCSHVWFPTVQEVLQADWQDVWHSPHPPFFIVFCNTWVFNVFTCFMLISSWYFYNHTYCNYITSTKKCNLFFGEVFFDHFLQASRPAKGYCPTLQVMSPSTSLRTSNRSKKIFIMTTYRRSYHCQDIIRGL